MSFLSLSLRRQENRITNIGIGMNVDTIDDIRKSRYYADFVTLNPSDMTNLQPTRNTYNLTNINSLASNAILNNLNVRIDSLFDNLPSWLTSLTDTNVISNVITNHISNVISNLNSNHSNGIIEYNLLRNSLNSNGYNNTFLGNKLGNSNQFSIIYNTANNIIGSSSKVQLFYNHSNAEDGYSSNDFFISTLRNFKNWRYPIDGVSFDILGNNRTSLIKIENTFRNLSTLGYKIKINRLSYSIPSPPTHENLTLQSNFYKSIIELAINYNIRSVSFNSFSDLFNSDNTPNITYSNVKTLIETFNPNWLGIIHTRRNNPMDFFNNSNRFIRDDFPLNLNNSITDPSGGSNFIKNTNTDFNLNNNIPYSNRNNTITSSNLNISIPNDFLGISGTPAITDPYGDNLRFSFINLMNLLRFTKKSDMGMRFRCFLRISTSPNDQYGNYKIIQYVNKLSLINAKVAISIGATGINNKRARLLSNALYQSYLDNYVNTASNVRNWINDDLFESFEIFNEPDMPVEHFGFVRNESNITEEFETAYKALIPRLYANSNIGDSLVLGSFAGKDFYKGSELSNLSGKIKSLAFHLYPAGSDKQGLKVCTPDTTDSSKCYTIVKSTPQRTYMDPANLNSNYTGTIIPASNPTPVKVDKLQGRSYDGNKIALRNDHGRTIDGLMASTDRGKDYLDQINEINNAIKEPTGYTGDYNYGFHLNETNSIAVSGAYGVSDVFASALWVIEYSLFNIFYGMKRMNLHTFFTPDNAYNLIDYPDTYDIDTRFDSKVNVKPLFYGYWFLHFALQCGQKDSKNRDSPILLKYFKNQSISVWKLRNSSQYTYVGICYDGISSTRTFTLPIVSPYPKDSTHPTGKLYHLRCEDGISGLKGISFGNLSLDGTNDGIPYNIKNPLKVPISLTEAGIQSALEFQTIAPDKSGSWLYNVSVQSPSAFILKI